MPKRIVRKRVRGWRMPDGARYVGRPGPYGNPFKLVGDMIYCDASHRRKILDPWVIFVDRTFDREQGERAVVFLYHHWLSGLYDWAGIVRPRPFTLDEMREDLHGKDLACWCPESRPCHADILLRVAND